jgi:primosomal replication protein N
LNRVELSGRLAELGALRHTPAGIPVIEFRVRHESSAEEAGAARQVRLEIDAVAFEGQARLVSGTPLDRALRMEGFLCARSRRSRKPVLHVTKIEFVEGV